ncbi:MAG: SusC/RagA family TonB-linked outer membrane protein, partial [Prevotellaceae bacterium]|nr:SusC/RagA family TonB-linked outer membrane protein [Prevotellaceae bacterium]
LGLTSREEAVGGRGRIDVALGQSDQAIDEVVVIGYGTQRRSDVTGSIASMQGSVLREVHSGNISQSLQGRVAGVEMTQNSSRPGAAMDIRIRGTRSLTASNDPLVVLDGIPFAGSISDINPSDIKSLDILKDASATAIYGSRGANGVIIITTFRGEAVALSKPVVTYNGYYGVKNLLNEYPMMDGPEFLAWRKEAQKNGASFTLGADEDESLSTDWQDLLFESGMVTSHDVSVAGVTNGGGYSFSGGYYDETAVLPGQGYERFSLRGSFDQKIGKRVKVGVSSINSYGVTEGERDSPLGSMLAITPLTNPYNKDGSIKTGRMYVNNMDTYYNPLTVSSLGDLQKEERKTYASYNSLYGEVQLFDGLRYRLNAGLNYRQSNYGNFHAPNTLYNGDEENSNAAISNELTTSWAVENLLYYDKIFAEKHKVGLVAMYSAEQTESNISSISAKGIAADYLQYYNFGLLNDNGEITINPDNQKYYKRGLLSTMFRATYGYDEKYMLTLTYRNDGSSVLADGYKWHAYPAVSVGWNVTNEEFMQGVSVLNNLKLRVGYGQTSNQAINPYQTLGGLSLDRYNFGEKNVGGYYVSTLPNYSLGWEYSTTWNFGLDFGLLDNRLTGTLEYYSQQTKDVLVSQNLPPSSGVTGSFMVNMGETKNKGFELSLSYAVLKNFNGWDWDVGFNVYANQNEIVSLASGQQYDKGNGWFVGQPIDVIYDFKKIGIWQLGEEDEVKKYEGNTGQVGMIKVEYTGEYDASGNPVRTISQGTTLEDDDRQILGSIEPDFQGGFNTRVGYKGFDLSLIGFYKSGGLLVSSLHSLTSYLNQNNGRRGQIKIDYWTPTNPTNAYPKPYGPEQNNHPIHTNSLAYFDASYVKISNVTLGYSFKSEWTKPLNIERLRLYVMVQNPFIFASDYYSETGLDPQPNSRGRDSFTQAQAQNSTVPERINVVGYNTPATRNYLVGLSVTF